MNARKRQRGFTAPNTLPRLSRRGFLRAGGAGASGLVVGIAAGVAGTAAAGQHHGAASATVLTGDQRVAFYGAHQPGVAVPPQATGTLVAFDLDEGVDRVALARLMRTWTSIAAQCMAGQPLADGDDGMAYGRGPAALTVMVGFGASMLRRIGLSHQVPSALAPIPVFLGDQLDSSASDGDLALFVAGNDGLVVTHALRAMQRVAAKLTRQRWQISGFSDPPGIKPTPEATPRNLMGQLDGTNNPKPGSAEFDRAIWVAADGQPLWMRGGTYLVFRRIRMLLTDWDALSRTQQENVIGRSKATGAPLSGGNEFTPPDYTKLTATGALAIPAEAHIRQANPQTNNGATILRRPFNYDNGLRSDGSPDAGLMFLTFQADPRSGFVPIQQRLAGADTLSTFIRHEASALFAIPPGCRPGGYLGQQLLEAT